MKLALNKKSAEALYELANKLPTSVDAITEETEKLLALYKSLEADLGIHREQFESLLLHAQKSIILLSSSISQAQIILYLTGDYILRYIGREDLEFGQIPSNQNASYVLSTKKDGIRPKRSPQETEDFTMHNFLENNGYINGNLFSFMRIIEDGKAILVRRKGSPTGYQKPDQYKYESSNSILYIVEEKNYSVENGLHSLVNAIVSQAENRIRNCLDVEVSEGLMGNECVGKINKLVLTFCIDLKGHEKHKDDSQVLISELQQLNIRNQSKLQTMDFVDVIKGKLLERFPDQKELTDRVSLRIVTYLGDIPNKSLCE